MDHLKFFLIVVGLMIVGQPTLLADNTVEPAVKVVEQPATTEEFDAQIRLARQLIKHDDCHGAAAVLEPLYAEYPSHDLIYNLLHQCYQKLDYLPKLEDLARRMIQQHPQSYRYHLDLANILVRLERAEESLESYRKAVRLAETDSQYLSVTNGMANAGFADEALALMDSLRGRIEDPAAFVLQRGMILEAQRLYREAVLEYLPLLDDTTREASNAERRLLALLEFPASSEQAEATLLEDVDATSNSWAIGTLTGYYLKADRLDEAYRYTLRLDSLEGLDGQALVRFMRGCSERRRFELAVRMGEHFFAHYRQSPVTTEAHLVYADALTQMGRYDAAINVYDSLVAWAPREQDQGEGLYYIGMIYLDYLNDYESARRYFDSVVTHYRRGVGYLRAYVARPYCDLRQGKLEAAAAGLSALGQVQLNDEIAEEVDYHLAVIEYCQGRYDSAGVALQRLMVSYPRGFYVNDAMQLLLAMDRVGEDTLPMAAYAKALRYELRRMPDSLEAALMSIVDGPSRSLADFALYRLLNIGLAEDDTAGVLTYVGRLEKEYPESYYYPYGLKARADLFRLDSGRVDQSKLIYRRLLESFPDYPFASEVRQRLRELEDDDRIG